MSKRPDIRWRKSDLAELERTIKNFNAKIYYNRNKHPENKDYLPHTQTKTGAIANIKTRKDYNDYIASLRRFSQRGAEKPIKGKEGLKTTQWEWEEYKRKEDAQNRWKAREKRRIEKLDELSRGKKTGNKVQMGTEAINSLEPRNRDINKIRGYEWERFIMSVDNQINDKKRQEHLERVKDNYITALITTGISDDIIDKIRGTDPQKISDTMMIDKEAGITFIYDRTQFEEKEKALRNVWGIKDPEE